MIARVLGLAGAALALAGCGSFGDFTGFAMPRGDLAVRSVGPEEQTASRGRFDTAVYSVEDAETVHLLLIDGSEAAPSQVVHVKMFWRPRAGRTPFDPTATNTTVRYVVFEGDHVGVYGGGGLLRPHDLPGDERWGATLLNATLRLLDRSEGYEPALGDLVIAEGAIKAERDELRTLTLLRKITARVEDRLGYPRLVEAH
jgi:hypothetical protein